MRANGYLAFRLAVDRRYGSSTRQFSWSGLAQSAFFPPVEPCVRLARSREACIEWTSSAIDLTIARSRNLSKLVSFSNSSPSTPSAASPRCRALPKMRSRSDQRLCSMIVLSHFLASTFFLSACSAVISISFFRISKSSNLLSKSSRTATMSTFFVAFDRAR